MHSVHVCPFDFCSFTFVAYSTQNKLLAVVYVHYVRMWLTCSFQNARLTVGAVVTLEIACAARSMGAISTMCTKPTTEHASVSNYQQIR